MDSDEVGAAAAVSEHASLGFNAAAFFKIFQSRCYRLLRKSEFGNGIQEPTFVRESLNSVVWHKRFQKGFVS